MSDLTRRPFTAADRQSLQAVLLDAFPTLDDLTRFVAVELAQNLEQEVVVQGRNLVQITQDFVAAYCTNDAHIHQLLDGALQSNPNHLGLAELASSWRQIRFIMTPACPYPGMSPFSTQESKHFYGRRRETDQLLRLLRLHPFLTIIGPSGSGKSSLVFAGLVPALRESTLFGSGSWTVRTMRPGDRPQQTLEATLADEIHVDDGPVRSGKQAHTLLIIDQFEELFTLSLQSEAAAFKGRLQEILDTPGLFVALTVRADFYHNLMALPLWPNIQAHRFEILPLTTDGLRDAIVRPAAEAGVTVEPALVERLIADAAGEPGVLPFMQETLVLLWDKVTEHQMTLRAYTDLLAQDHSAGGSGLNGLQVAMAQRAEQLFQTLPENQQAIARRTFLRLLQFGEGRPDTRRRQPLHTFYSELDEQGEVDATINRLADGRLIVKSGDESETLVDIGHEALIDGWPRLKRWRQESEAAEKTRRRLEAKRQEWIRLGQGTGGLLDPTELQEADLWLSTEDAGIVGNAPGIKEYVQASRQAINPGFEPLGLAAVIAASIALLALAFIAFLFIRITPLALPVERGATAGLLIAFVALFAFVLYQLRVDSYVVQRWSHAIRDRRTTQLLLLSLVASSVTFFLWFQRTSIAQVNECEALGVKIGDPSLRTLAVTSESLDSLWLELFRLTIESRSDGRLLARLLSESQVQHCARFIDYRVAVRRTEQPATQEVAYTASIIDSRKATSPAPQNVIGQDSCGLAPFLALKVLQELTFYTGVLREDAVLPAPQACEPYLANQEGFAAYQRRDYGVAIDRYRTAIALSDGEGRPFALAHGNLGTALLDSGRADEAEEELATAVELSQESYEPFLIDYARACYRTGDYVCSESANRAVIKLAQMPLSVVRAYNNLSVTYRAMKRYDEALAALDKAEEQLLRVDDAPSDVLFLTYVVNKNRGIVHYLNGDLAVARDLLETAQRNGRTFAEEISYYLILLDIADEKEPICPALQRYIALPESGLFDEAKRRSQADALYQKYTCNSQP